MAIVSTGQITITDVNDAVSARLSNEFSGVPTNADGSGGNFTGCSTTITVSQGLQDITANGWTITASLSAGLTGSLSGRTYTVTGLTVDSGYVDLVATHSNGDVLSKRFTVTKVKKGEAGAAGRSGLNFAEAKSLFTDPTFQIGTNTTAVYNNLGNGTVTITREAKQPDSPFTDSGFNLKISNTGAASPGIGGFIHSFTGRASAVFVQRIVAKIPVGYTIEQATNAIGDGATNEWITSKAGTGKFEEYILVRRCGATGTFSGSGHIYLNGAAGSAGAPVNWYIAYAATYDFTSVGFGAVTAVLSNEAHTVPTDSAGNNGNFTGCATTVTIYNGTTDDSANWTVAATPIAGVTGSLVGKTYTVTGMTVDTGYVDLVASRSGYASVTKRFTLTKSKAGATGATGATGAAGAAGAQGPSVLVTPDRATTFTATDGTLDASQADIVFTAAVSGVASPTYVWSFSGFQTAPTNSGAATQTITAAQFGTAKSAIVTCTVNGTYTDKVTIVRLEKSTAAAGATVGAPTGTYVGGVLAETVAGKADGALQKAGDAITGPVTFATNGGILAATDANNGVFMGPNGLVGKKAGENTFAISTDGTAYFDGAYMREGSVGNAQIGKAAINRANIGELSVDALRIQGGAVTYTNVLQVVNTSIKAANTQVCLMAFPEVAGEASIMKVYITPSSGAESQLFNTGRGQMQFSTNGSTWVTVYDTNLAQAGYRGMFAFAAEVQTFGGTPAYLWTNTSTPAARLLNMYGVTGSGPLTFLWKVPVAGTYTFECAADDYLVNGTSSIQIGNQGTYPVEYTNFREGAPYTCTFTCTEGEIITAILRYGNSGGDAGVGARILNSNGEVVWNTRRANYNPNSYRYFRLLVSGTTSSPSNINAWVMLEITRK